MPPKKSRKTKARQGDEKQHNALLETMEIQTKIAKRSKGPTVEERYEQLRQEVIELQKAQDQMQERHDRERRALIAEIRVRGKEMRPLGMLISSRRHAL